MTIYEKTGNEFPCTVSNRQELYWFETKVGTALIMSSAYYKRPQSKKPEVKKSAAPQPEKTKQESAQKPGIKKDKPQEKTTTETKKDTEIKKDTESK